MLLVHTCLTSTVAYSKMTTDRVLHLGYKTPLLNLYLIHIYSVRRRKRNTKKYGVLSDEHLQLTNADEDEEDELFDQSRRRLITG